ncbi:MAG: hypothetical protein EAZ13_09610 [Sphingobacteriia bacterium]|nr:MAG: hypothetical protein EAZ13_09610 [Sphingobacteriia bacterium]
MNGSTLLIYTAVEQVRLSYIVSTLLGEQVFITQSKEQFIAFNGYKISYAAKRIGNEELHIAPHGLLQQIGIQDQQVDCFKWEGFPVFFKTNGDIPFDFFSAAFYLITRYEEYLPSAKDAYGRYSHENSIAYQQNFLHQPIIQYWRSKIFSPSTFPSLPFSFSPSYDIDIAYSYRSHSILRNTLGYFRDLLKGNSISITERMRVLFESQQDPYDVYEWLALLHSSLQLKPIYFFLLASKRNKLDKNISPRSTALQILIKKIVKQNRVGIHPSTQSTKDEWVLKNEIDNLQSIVKQPVQLSRQHYIFLEHPNTYQRLIEAGITHDYSMGYPSINGFRASYAAAFTWFNLQTNQSSALTIHPFCYMDATAIFQEKISPANALQQMQYYFDTVKSVGGEFIPVMHNNLLTTQPGFIAWRNIYADFLLKNCTKLV